MPFTCAVCGEYHDELMLDIRMGLPEEVFRTPARERNDRFESGEDACTFVDEDGRVRHYVRGLLELPISERDTYFGFGSWVEVSGEDYDQLRALWDDPTAAGLEFQGLLANELEPYDGTEGLGLTLRLRSVELLPTIELADAAHPLVRDFRGGIDLHRAAELARTVHH